MPVVVDAAAQPPDAVDVPVDIGREALGRGPAVALCGDAFDKEPTRAGDRNDGRQEKYGEKKDAKDSDR